MQQLSASKLNLYKDSPLDFWLTVNRGISRPRGIMASLPSGMDRIIKNYMDEARKIPRFLPPELTGTGLNINLFPDQEKLKKWRHWNNNLKVHLPELDMTIIGAFDDLLVDFDNGLYTPFDYKTKGSPSSVESTEKYYQLQADIYTLMLDRHGYTVSGKALFLYWSPKQVISRELPGHVEFETQRIIIDASAERAYDFLKEVRECLDGPMPQETGNEYDLYVTQKVAALEETMEDENAEV